METPQVRAGSGAVLAASLDLYAANFDLMLETPRPAVRKRARLAFRQLQLAVDAHSPWASQETAGVLLALVEAMRSLEGDEAARDQARREHALALDALRDFLRSSDAPWR